MKNKQIKIKVLIFVSLYSFLSAQMNHSDNRINSFSEKFELDCVEYTDINLINHDVPEVDELLKWGGTDVKQTVSSYAEGGFVQNRKNFFIYTDDELTALVIVRKFESSDPAIHFLLGRLSVSPMPDDLLLRKWSVYPNGPGDICIIGNFFREGERVFDERYISFIRGNVLVMIASQQNNSTIKDLAKIIDNALFKKE